MLAWVAIVPFTQGTFKIGKKKSSKVTEPVQHKYWNKLFLRKKKHTPNYTVKNDELCRPVAV